MTSVKPIRDPEEIEAPTGKGTRQARALVLTPEEIKRRKKKKPGQEKKHKALPTVEALNLTGHEEPSVKTLLLELDPYAEYDNAQ